MTESVLGQTDRFRFNNCSFGLRVAYGQSEYRIRDLIHTVIQKRPGVVRRVTQKRG